MMFKHILSFFIMERKGYTEDNKNREWLTGQKEEIP
jgi:hypothetical protein